MWAIFKREQTAQLCIYLHESFPQAEGDILAHQVFLTESHFVKLASKGIYAFRFEQKRGQAVFIPAGCVHQVRSTYLHSTPLPN